MGNPKAMGTKWYVNAFENGGRPVPSFTSVFGLREIQNTFNIIQLDTQT
jgi:hypothetical protein